MILKIFLPRFKTNLLSFTFPQANHIGLYTEGPCIRSFAEIKTFSMFAYKFALSDCYKAVVIVKKVLYRDIIKFGKLVRYGFIKAVVIACFKIYVCATSSFLGAISLKLRTNKGECFVSPFSVCDIIYIFSAVC